MCSRAFSFSSFGISPQQKSDLQEIDVFSPLALPSGRSNTIRPLEGRSYSNVPSSEANSKGTP